MLTSFLYYFSVMNLSFGVVFSVHTLMCTMSVRFAIAVFHVYVRAMYACVLSYTHVFVQFYESLILLYFSKADME